MLIVPGEGADVTVTHQLRQGQRVHSANEPVGRIAVANRIRVRGSAKLLTYSFEATAYSVFCPGSIFRYHDCTLLTRTGPAPQARLSL